MEYLAEARPRRVNAKTIHIELAEDGCFTESGFDTKIHYHKDLANLIAIINISNSSGYINPISGKQKSIYDYHPDHRLLCIAISQQ